MTHQYYRLCTLALGLLALGSTAQAQRKASTKQATHQVTPQHGRPRLVVTMMVDQMTWDYLYRYQARFVEGGFKRLLTQGFNCENTRINYLPSVTAIGHSSVHTGSVPAIHGIAGNDFVKDHAPIYCTEDRSVTTVGAPNGKSGQMSPRNLLATTIADELRIDQVVADVLPDQKHGHVQALQAQGHTVVMAGDGVNDAPALAVADVGVAMGTGTDVAIESADVTLLGGDLAALVKARDLSVDTMRNIRQNLVFAFVYNVFGIPLAAGALYPAFGWLLSPVIAAAAMALSSVSVITNSLRLRRHR